MQTINKEYALLYVKEEVVEDLVNLITIIHEYRNHVNTNTYKNAVKKLKSYYNFDNDNDTALCSILMEKDQVVKNANLTDDNIVAFARAEILVIPE